MPKDYKRARGASKPSKPSFDARAFIAGVLLGVGVSVGVFFAQRYALLAPITITRADIKPPPARVLESPPPEPEPEKLKFEFYTMLPEMEVAVPDKELEPAPPKQGKAPQPLKGTYVLQVGSFRKPEDAEKLKANLALLGLEAHVQTVSINGEQTWHRVRLGPFSAKNGLDETRSRLYQNQIDAIVLKLRG